MITRILLENFMAHARTELELGPGVTVLAGPNNTGKSAVVEALRCVATNQLNHAFIRHGAKEARVSVTFDDGRTVTWVRRKTYALYEVLEPGTEEPETFAKFGRNTPEDVARILGLSPVEVEGATEAVDVHLGDQKDPIFLLNRSGFQAAHFFAAHSEAAHLLTMQKQLKDRIKDAKRSVRDQTERLEHMEQDLDDLAALPDMRLRLDRAREQQETLDTAGRDLPRLDRTARDLRTAQARRTRLQDTTRTLAPLAEPPALADTAGLDRALQDRLEAEAALQRARQRGAALAPLAPAPDVTPTAPMARTLRDLHAAHAAVAALSRTAVALSPLADPPQPEDTAALARAISALRTTLARHSTATLRMEAARDLPEPPQPAPTHDLIQTAANLTKARARRDTLRKELDTRRDRLERLRRDIAARLEQVGACPLCGGELHVDHFLEHDEPVTGAETGAKA